MNETRKIHEPVRPRVLSEQGRLGDMQKILLTMNCLLSGLPVSPESAMLASNTSLLLELVDISRAELSGIAEDLLCDHSDLRQRVNLARDEVLGALAALELIMALAKASEASIDGWQLYCGLEPVLTIIDKGCSALDVIAIDAGGGEDSE